MDKENYHQWTWLFLWDFKVLRWLYFIWCSNGGGVQSAWSIKQRLKVKWFLNAIIQMFPLKPPRNVLRNAKENFFFSFSVYFTCLCLGNFWYVLKSFGVSGNNLWSWRDWQVIGLTVSGMCHSWEGDNQWETSACVRMMTAHFLLSLPYRPALQLWGCDF